MAFLWAEVLNRAQDTMDLYFIDAKSGRSRKVLTESSPGNWVNVNDVFRVLKSGDRFLWSSWRDGHTHLYLYSFDKQNPLNADAKLERQLDKGDYEVLAVEAVDGNAVYFTSNQDDPRKRGVFSVRLDGGDVRRLSQPDGWHTASFSDDGKHWLDRFSNASTPPKWSLCGGDGGACSSDVGVARRRRLRSSAAEVSRIQGRRRHHSLRTTVASAKCSQRENSSGHVCLFRTGGAGGHRRLGRYDVSVP